MNKVFSLRNIIESDVSHIIIEYMTIKEYFRLLYSSKAFYKNEHTANRTLYDICDSDKTNDKFTHIPLDDEYILNLKCVDNIRLKYSAPITRFIKANQQHAHSDGGILTIVKCQCTKCDYKCYCNKRNGKMCDYFIILSGDKDTPVEDALAEYICYKSRRTIAISNKLSAFAQII